jgi:glycosyltransferase involved in cell wall biosynthesis
MLHRDPRGEGRRSTGGDLLDIALIGTRGVPAHYGGFETCVEEVGTRLAARGHRVTVYCRRQADVEPLKTYRGMELVHLPALRKRALETLSHTALSVGHQLLHAADAAVVFNSANAPLLPVLRARGVPVATHVDGLEWRRAKWSGMGQRYYRMAEKLAVRWSDALIADAQGIADYYRAEHDADTELISYGAPLIGRADDRLAELGLESDNFHLVVARFEPENHVAEIVRGYVASKAAKPLVVVGSAPYAHEYTRQVQAAADDRVRFLGGVWDQQLLDQLYAGATTYLHGHSVGGTNPSLLRALGAGTATNAFDVNFNREVVGQSGRFFSTPEQLTALLEHDETSPAELLRRRTQARERARAYDWDDVADRYETLCRNLAGHTVAALAEQAA